MINNVVAACGAEATAGRVSHGDRYEFETQ